MWRGREVVEAGIPALAQAGSAPGGQDAEAGQLLEEQLASLTPGEFLALLGAVLGAARSCLHHVAAVQQYALLARCCEPPGLGWGTSRAWSDL